MLIKGRYIPVLFLLWYYAIFVVMEDYESVFDKTEIHSVYNVSRNLSKETLQMWMDKVAEAVQSANIKSIVDLGCGTGRFTNPLADKFNCNVIGVDPSEKMLSVAKENTDSQLVKFINGSSSGVPLESASVDLIFLSQIYHHISDLNAFVSECSRLLKDGGFVCIRNSTVDDMNSYLYPRFFPKAYEIDMRRLPVRSDIIKLFEENNFTTILSGPVEQIFALTHMDYYNKISLRGCSDLAAITDSEFYEGLQKLKDYCSQPGRDKPVYEEIDLHIFKKA
jgi:ubiquinone/menaquinone biosynthesis C-methylase UbiE